MMLPKINFRLLKTGEYLGRLIIEEIVGNKLYYVYYILATYSFLTDVILHYVVKQLLCI